MKTNKMMRVASVLLVAVLLTTCAISGTFAKYTVNGSGNDKARVAYWGWNLDTEMVINDLFDATYTDVVSSADLDGANGNDDVIAPGTTSSANFTYAYTNYQDTKIIAPEVDYNFTITVTETCDDDIKANTNIKWYLDDAEMTGEALTWDELVDAIVKLSGATTVTETGDVHTATVSYAAGQVPTAFAVGSEHTITWQWVFEDATDVLDTTMGNKQTLDECSITIAIDITQTDGTPIA